MAMIENLVKWVCKFFVNIIERLILKSNVVKPSSQQQINLKMLYSLSVLSITTLTIITACKNMLLQIQSFCSCFKHFHSLFHKRFGECSIYLPCSAILRSIDKCLKLRPSTG